MLQVADEGEGFMPAEVPDPSVDPLAHINDRMQNGKRLGGYGIHLIKSLMDKVLFNAKGNVVIAIKYLNQAAYSEEIMHLNFKRFSIFFADSAFCIGLVLLRRF